MDIKQRISFLLTGVNLWKAEEKLQSLTLLSSEELTIYREKAKWDIAQYHFEHTSVFRDKIRGQVLPTNWEQLPIMEKFDFNKPFSSTLAETFRLSKVYTNKTSGSSGTPMFFARDKDCHGMIWAYVNKRYANLGIPVGTKCGWFYGIPKEFFPRSKERIKDWLMNRYRFPIFEHSDDEMIKTYKELKNGNYKSIYGYTGAIALFSRFILSQGFHLSNPIKNIKVVIVTSEFCSLEEREIIGKAFNSKVCSEYGSSEFGYIGYDIGHNKWRIASENLIVEVLPINGMPVEEYGGKLLITDLNNKAFPFIRFNIGDIAKLESSHGYFNDTIYDLQGRESDIIKLPSGRIVPGLVFYYISKSIIEQSRGMRQYIVRQTAIDHFDFIIEADHPLETNTEEEVKEKIEYYLEKGINIAFIYDEPIKKTLAGKIKQFISIME